MRYSNKFKRSGFLAIFLPLIVTTILSTTPLLAQDNGPQGYCIPKTDFEQYASDPEYYAAYYYCYPDYPEKYYYYKDYYGSAIEYVKITASDGTVVLYNYTGPDYVNYNAISRCYNYYADDYDGWGQFVPGDEYTIEWKSQAHSYWYYTYPTNYYCDYYSYRRFTGRLFFDYNKDADYNDPKDDNYPKNDGSDEYVLWWEYYTGYGYGNYCTNHTFTGQFTVPADVDPGKTRLRLTSQAYSTAYPYIQDRNNACVGGYLYKWWYSYYNGWYAYQYDYGEMEEYLVEFIIPIKATFPDADDVLYANRAYDGVAKEVDDVVTPFPNPMVELRDPAATGTMCSYQIKGPLPSQEVVYTGLDAAGNSKFDLSKPWSTSEPTMFEFTKSTGKFTTGNGDVAFTSSGEYYVELSLWLPGKDTPKMMTKRFTVSFANDMSTMDITNPVKFYTTEEKPYLNKYSRGLNIPLTAVYKNTGKNTVTRFDAKLTIHEAEPVFSNNKIVDYKYGAEILNETITYDTSKAGCVPLEAKAETEVDFGVYTPSETGVFIINAYCTLRSGNDEEAYNDSYPRSVFLTGEPNVWPFGSKPLMMFEVADEIESEAVLSLVPAQGDTMIVNRPFFPVCEVKNNGVSDISNATATITYQHKTIPSANKTVTMIVEDIPSGLYNRKSITFPPAELKEPGEYVGTFTLKSNGDVVLYNDEIKFTFYVEKGVQGTFEVGAGKDFTTIQAALDHLYRYGMEGSVELVLTDAIYDVYSPTSTAPAWDLSTAIMGLGVQEDGSINTLMIRPSDERKVTRAGTTVRLHSGNGKGIYFGQDIQNNSNSSIIRENLMSSQYRNYYNSPGYITFEGGANKSLKFELYSQSDVHGAVFYLNRGSENITIQNCILENKTPALRDKVYLPHVKHSDADGFYFERDSASVGDSYDGYSAGIASRGTLFDAIVVRFDSNGDPIDPTEEQTPDQEIEKRTMVLDTIPNSHNTFKNNEISGFGYGILSTGLGALFNTREAKYTRYYNKGNVIEGNIITDVARAGIFVGNEEDLTIKNNIISGVSGEGDGKAAAIQVGTSSRGAYKAFNNLEVDIQGNTINGVTGSDYSNGIRIEQGFTRFVDPIGGFEVFPGDDDNITATSNAIWNIKVMNAATGRAGIYALTERIEDKNEYTVLTNPLYPDYLIKNLAITNNTILLGNDGFDNEGLYFGVGIQQATNVTYANNAISIKDNVSAGATIRAASFLQGLSPNKGFINSDCNAIWMTDADMDVVRFIESTPMTINDHLATGFLHSGYNGEYKTIRQWRNWTGMDKNTTTHKDFTDNYTFTGTPAKLAIVTPKPIASILNNRGLNLEGDHYDMNGLRRGASNEPFDIGAIEFNSKMRGLDGELIDIIAPANYRESVGTFNGCEYVMTTAPVEVAAYVRNNGTILQTKLPVTVKIDRDDYGTLHNVLETTVYANVASYASVEVPFGLADGAGVEFKPETYAELDMPIDDNTFYGMEENVTPVYTITVTSGDDEDNTNNVSVKKVRFYVMRSGMKLLECNENLMANYETSSNPEVLASNLNAAAIEAGLREIGYYNVTRQEAMANKELNLDVDTEYKQDIDRFNRNSWPERSLDYSMYRTVIWSDGNNNNLSRYSAMALRDFVNSIDENSTDLKKNLLVASEEIVRNNVGLDIDYNFTQEVFFATSKDPHTPMGIDKDMGTYNAYNNKTVTGVDIARQMEETIRATSNANDMLPYPGLLSLVEGDGLTKTAFIYNETADGIGEEVPEDNRIMGVTHVETDKNILLYAVDWRHFGDIENMLRASLDFVTKSGGEVVPIDMYSFDANAVGNRVELNWSTASEANSSHFDIERRNDDATFATIASKEAAGNSNNIRHYNMTDNEVKLGNTYTYRLKLVDKDGSFSYSGNQTVTLESATGSLTVGELAPNPTANSSAINVTLSESADLRIELFNAAGALVAVAYDAYTPAGSRSINIDVAKLAQGSYTVVIRSGQNSEVKTMNVIR